MEQLTLALVRPAEPRFANFVVGDNGELLALLQAMKTGARREKSLVLWGQSGAGKSHLLKAFAAALQAEGETVALLGAEDAGDLPEVKWLLVDCLDWPSEARAAALFTWYNANIPFGASLVLAQRTPPAGAPIRDDIKTRLLAGLVYSVRPLAEAEVALALADEAKRRGLPLSEDIARYLLSRFARDTRTQLALLDALDRYALRVKRPVTLPLLRKVLEAERGLADGLGALAC